MKEDGIVLAVVGSREFGDEEHVCRILDAIHARLKIKRIVSGGARGPDRWAIVWAKKNNVPYSEHLADWNRWGKSAGFRRNADIVNECERLVAFWDGESKGTKSSIGIARKQKKPRRIVYSKM